MSERVRRVMEPGKVLLAPPHMTVSEAARLMAQKRVSAIMVVESGSLVGIFTERDAVFRVVAEDRDARSTRLAAVMTPAPRTIGPEESFGYALLVMHENGFRHLPVVENGVPIGILSARDALDPELEEFTAEASRRRHIRPRS
ncbi:MAG: CBS domain-containing protein [Betaproteobacteria bacterium]|nr:CBS domain-containing protein [Betaproteobacteria bacterium]